MIHSTCIWLIQPVLNWLVLHAIISTCMGLIPPIFEQFNLSSIDIDLHLIAMIILDPFNLHLMLNWWVQPVCDDHCDSFSVCVICWICTGIWSIQPIFDWFKLYLIDKSFYSIGEQFNLSQVDFDLHGIALTKVWSIHPALIIFDPFTGNLHLIDSTCTWLICPLYNHFNLHGIDSTHIWTIQLVFDNKFDWYWPCIWLLW